MVLHILKKYTNSLIHLLYPNQCLVCVQELPIDNELSICHICQDNFHLTHFESDKTTRLDKLFWGRVKLTSTFSLLEFEKQNSTQKILHSIKYKNNKLLAIEMGKKIGNVISQDATYSSIEGLIPVPLHPKKDYLRGYNQSEMIAIGIHKILGVKVCTNLVYRNIHTESQTKKGKFTRWENVRDVFNINVKELAKLQHIAIIDDVITTGATIEAITLKIQEEIPHLKISIISLAIAK